MDKEKEIKEMTEAVMCAMEYRKKTGTPNFEMIAKNLINADYGDVKKAVKEFAEIKVKPLIDEIVELMFDASRSVCQIEGCFKSDDIQCGANICVEENKRLWKNKVDTLIKEFYGK